MENPLPEAGRKITTEEELQLYLNIDDDLKEDLQFLVNTAARICSSNISLVTVLTATKQHFISKLGTDATETPIEFAFCAHAVRHSDDIFIIEDATKDDRFKDNPLVTGEPHVRFYAGAPITSGGNDRLGTLCVINNEPGTLDDEDRTLLIQLSRQVSNLLALRKRTKELEEEQIRLKDVLQIASDQNDRLKNFANIVSHNLRSHSAGLTGMFNILRQDFPEMQQNEVFEYMDSGLQNLTQTISGLSDIIHSNSVSSQKKPLNLQSFIVKNKKTLKSQIETAGFTISSDLPDDFDVMAIEPYLDSIILNIMTNAIKYRNPGATSYLKIRAEKDTFSTSIFFEDNGLGIDMKRYGSKLFGLYNQFHSSEDSRGIGLFITRNQVESMGGTIRADSTPGVGTTFIVTLPNS